MGNLCCGLRRGSPSMVWAADDDDDDWASPVVLLEEKESLLGYDENNKESASSAAREVKIKISKKQLEELLARGNVQDIPVDQVLSRLMKASDEFEIHYQRSWRPVLQTIPELN